MRWREEAMAQKFFASIYAPHETLFVPPPAALHTHTHTRPLSPRVICCSIRENIMNGKLGATEEEMIQAAKAAYIHDFIMELPDKYDQQVRPSASLYVQIYKSTLKNQN